MFCSLFSLRSYWLAAAGAPAAAAAARSGGDAAATVSISTAAVSLQNVVVCMPICYTLYTLHTKLLYISYMVVV